MAKTADIVFVIVYATILLTIFSGLITYIIYNSTPPCGSLSKKDIIEYKLNKNIPNHEYEYPYPVLSRINCDNLTIEDCLNLVRRTVSDTETSALCISRFLFILLTIMSIFIFVGILLIALNPPY